MEDEAPLQQSILNGLLPVTAIGYAFARVVAVREQMHSAPAAILGLVHGQVGIRENIFNIASVVRDHRDPDARRDVKQLLLHGDR